MARVSGPMMSVDASGKFGGSMVFAKWKGRNYVRQLVTPKNPKAAKQTGVRSMLAFLAPLWTGLSAPHKATYDDLALAKAIGELRALPATPSSEEVDRIAEQWKPWRAVAARILWHHYLCERGRIALG